MKKRGKFLALAFTFTSIANNTFATTNSGVTDTKAGNGNIVPFLLGAVLILCVLFIGYKMDKSAENTPKIKKSKMKKIPNKKNDLESEEHSSKEETKVYAEENKNDIPYEADEDEYYENDKNFDYDGLNEEIEYEEDDISLFDMEDEHESSFEDIDDDISYDTDKQEEYSGYKDLNYDSNTVSYDNEIDSIKENIQEDNNNDTEIMSSEIDKKEEVEDLNTDSVPQVAKVESQDAESFMNEINKYKEMADDEEFTGFTTNPISRTEQKESFNKYLKKKETKKEAVSKEETVEETIEEPTGEMDLGFLNQMEQSLKKDQEERMKKLKNNSKDIEEELPKKRGRKPKNEE